LQDKLLKAALLHAYQQVPFYRRVWDDAGFNVHEVNGIGDLKHVPIITKQMVKEAALRGELLARNVDTSRCTYLDTSGSSGAPLRIWKQPLEERLRRATGLRIWFEHGFGWQDVTAQFQIKAGPQHALQRLGISRKIWISTDWPIGEQLARFHDTKADVVVGTPTALRRLAKALITADAEYKAPRIIFCAGELLDDQTRDIIKQALGIDPVGLYGQTEVGYVAWQCEQRKGFHVNSDTHVVEVLCGGQPAGPGELGTVTVTDLRARAMPLLRYDTEDLAIAATQACSCGRSLPVLWSIEGRAGSSVSLPNGRILTTRTIVNHLCGSLRLGEYRLHQEAINQFRLELVRRKEGLDRRADLHLLYRLHQLLHKADIRIETVDPWLPDGTGKTHSIFSAVPVAFEPRGSAPGVMSARPCVPAAQVN
jgi:phenylacetate-CoA ligase